MHTLVTQVIGSSNKVLLNSYLKQSWISFETQIKIDKIRKSLITGLTDDITFLYVG